MKVKKVKLGIKGVKEVLEDFVNTGEAIERGDDVRKEKAVYFESIKGFRKAITPKRVELLHIIREKHPKSIQELARLTKRDIKNIATDIGILEALGLVDIKEGMKDEKSLHQQWITIP